MCKIQLQTKLSSICNNQITMPKSKDWSLFLTFCIHSKTFLQWQAHASLKFENPTWTKVLKCWAPSYTISIAKICGTPSWKESYSSFFTLGFLAVLGGLITCPKIMINTGMKVPIKYTLRYTAIVSTKSNTWKPKLKVVSSQVSNLHHSFQGFVLCCLQAMKRKTFDPT